MLKVVCLPVLGAVSLLSFICWIWFLAVSASDRLRSRVLLRAGASLLIIERRELWPSFSFLLNWSNCTQKRSIRISELDQRQDYRRLRIGFFKNPSQKSYEVGNLIQSHRALKIGQILAQARQKTEERKSLNGKSAQNREKEGLKFTKFL